MPNRGRVPVAIALVLVAVTPVVIAISQSRLTTAARQFNHGHCGLAVKNALSASSMLAVRPEPYEIIGYCQMERGYPLQGTRAMRKAVQLDPNNWEYHYGLAVAQGATRTDPRREAARARALNPREDLTLTAVKGYSGTDPGQWQHEAESARIGLFNSGLLELP
jgi:Flp pilus assembly protein TadD